MARRTFRYVLWVKAHPDFVGGAWAKMRFDGKTFSAVDSPLSATRFKKKADAESAALLLTTKFPHKIGSVEIQEHSLGERWDRSIRIYDFTVNHNS